MKKLLLITCILFATISTFASSYEVVGYSVNKHYESTFGSMLLDNAQIAIVVGSDTYYIKFNPKTSHSTPKIVEYEATCNNIPCSLIIYNGTLEQIVIIFGNGDVLKFYVK